MSATRYYQAVRRLMDDESGQLRPHDRDATSAHAKRTPPANRTANGDHAVTEETGGHRIRGELDALVRKVGIFSWSTIGAVILIVLGAYILIEGRVIFAPLFLALIVVVVLNPLVTALQRRGIHRLVGAAIGFLAFLAALVALGLLVIPSIVDQASGFATEFPELYDKLADQIVSAGGRFGLDSSIWSYDQILDFLNDPENQDTILTVVFDRLGSLTSAVFEFILIFLLGPVVAFYLLIDLPNVQQRLLELVPSKSRAEVAYVGRRLNTAVGGFLRGQLLVAIIVGVMLSFGYWLIDLPFWLLIGLVGGVLNIVPFLGPWVGGILGVLLAHHRRSLDSRLGRRHCHHRAADRQQLRQPERPPRHGSPPPRRDAAGAGACGGDCRLLGHRHRRAAHRGPQDHRRVLVAHQDPRAESGRRGGVDVHRASEAQVLDPRDGRDQRPAGPGCSAGGTVGRGCSAAGIIAHGCR